MLDLNVPIPRHHLDKEIQHSFFESCLTSENFQARKDLLIDANILVVVAAASKRKLFEPRVLECSAGAQSLLGVADE